MEREIGGEMIQTLERKVNAQQLARIVDLPESIGAQTVTIVVCYEAPARTANIPVDNAEEKRQWEQADADAREAFLTAPFPSLSEIEKQRQHEIAMKVWADISEINSHYPKESHEIIAARAKAGRVEIEKEADKYKAKRARGELTADDCLEIDRLALEDHYLEKYLALDDEENDDA
jgi:hypothetical protein